MNTTKPIAITPDMSPNREAYAEGYNDGLAAALNAQPSAPRVVTNSEPSGTFECPVCGFDKPHHHGENDRFPWHMKYRTTFEDIVRKHIRAVGGGVMRQYVYGHSGAITIRPGQYLAYDGRRARDTAKQHDQTGTEWSAFSKSSPFNGGYEHEWLDDLWNIFKQTVAALESFATSLPHAAVPDGFIVIPMPNPEEMEALRSFAATAGDDESYTVSRELMSRLLLFGAVYRSTKRDWYYLTDFGRCLLAAAPQAGDRG